VSNQQQTASYHKVLQPQSYLLPLAPDPAKTDGICAGAGSQGATALLNGGQHSSRTAPQDSLLQPTDKKPSCHASAAQCKKTIRQIRSVGRKPPYPDKGVPFLNGRISPLTAARQGGVARVKGPPLTDPWGEGGGLSVPSGQGLSARRTRTWQYGGSAHRIAGPFDAAACRCRAVWWTFKCH
jgi:hypothetical protein